MHIICTGLFAEAVANQQFAVYGDSLKIRNVDTRLINIIPNSTSGEIVLAKIWVDQKNSVIMRSQVTTQTNGTVKTDYKYGAQLSYGLPSELKFEIDVTANAPDGG